jgi:hypothetical protein
MSNAMTPRPAMSDLNAAGWFFEKLPPTVIAIEACVESRQCQQRARGLTSW